MKQKVTAVLLVISIITLTASGIWLTITNDRIDALNYEIADLEKQIPTEQSSAENSTEPTERVPDSDSSNEYEALLEQYEGLQRDYAARTVKKEDIDKIVTEYITARYNYNGRLSESVYQIWDKVEDLCDESVLEALIDYGQKTASMGAGAGGGVSADDAIHNAEIVDIYYSRIKNPDSTDNHYKGQKTTNQPPYLVARVKMKISEVYYLYSSIDLVFQKDKWIITYERPMAQFFTNSDS